MNARGSLLKRMNRWLDWWCSSPLRVLLVWAVFTAGKSWMLNIGFSGWVFGMIEKVERQLGDASLLLATLDLHIVWHSSALWLLSTWFQPLLLRLPLWRSIVWIGMPIVVIIVWAIIPTSPSPWI